MEKHVVSPGADQGRHSRKEIHTKLGFNEKDSGDMLEPFLLISKDTIETGEMIMIAGFGNFEVKQKKDHRGRNP